MAAVSYLNSNTSARRLSHRSAARFFYLADVIGRLHEPTPTQLDALDRSYNSTGEFLAECPEFYGLLQEVHAHGSRRLGTLVKPLVARPEGFDVDLIARLDQVAARKYGGADGPSRLLGDLFSALQRYATAHGLRIHRWERCVTLEYANGMFADIAPVIDGPSMLGQYGSTRGFIPDRKLQRYVPTNPRGYAKGFDKVAATSPNFTSGLAFAKAMDSAARAEIEPLPAPEEVFNRLLSRLVQLLKLHRNVAFSETPASGGDVSPSSIFLTTLAAAAYTVQAPQPHNSPLELLLDIVKTMPSCFERKPRSDGTEHWLLANPSVPEENLAEGMNTPQKQAAFIWWHRRVTEHLAEIVDAIEGYAGMDVLLAALERAFGKRAAGAIRDDEANRRQSNRQIGRVALIAAGTAPVVAVARPHTFFGD